MADLAISVHTGRMAAFSALKLAGGKSRRLESHSLGLGFPEVKRRVGATREAVR